MIDGKKLFKCRNDVKQDIGWLRVRLRAPGTRQHHSHTHADTKHVDKHTCALPTHLWSWSKQKRHPQQKAHIQDRRYINAHEWCRKALWDVMVRAGTKRSHVSALMGREHKMWARMPTAGFCKNKKKYIKSSTKAASKGKKAQPKNAPPGSYILEIRIHKQQAKKRKKQQKTAEAARSKNTCKQTTKIATCKYLFKKLLDATKPQMQSRSATDYI